MRFKYLFCVFAISLKVNGTIIPSTLSCDSADSCSPSECIKNTEVNCSTKSQSYDFSAGLKETTCKTCTQSTLPRCTTLASTIKSNSGVAAAYCTDEFLIIWATGLPMYDVTTDYLSKIPLPPGGDAQCRVRTGSVQPNVYKIPINGVTAGTNSVPNSLPDVPGIPDAGAIGVAIDGVPFFPNYNNRGRPTWESCEVDRCNAHSGKGFDYHYHGDPFGEKCLYSAKDYSSDTVHPPLIGWALDGYSIHGRHINSKNQGIGTDLDNCGGHIHDGLAYHYHSTVTLNEVASKGLDGTKSTNGVKYTAYRLAPTTCWKGNVSLISNFWSGKQANYDRSKTSLTSSNDYQDIRPCCQSTSYAVTDNVALDKAITCTDGKKCSLGSISTITPNESCATAFNIWIFFISIFSSVHNITL